MAKTIEDRLRLIKAGLLTEAMSDDETDGTNYDLEQDVKPDNDDNPEPDDKDTDDTTAENTDDTGTDPATTAEDDTTGDYDLNVDDDNPATSDDTSTDSNNDAGSSDSSKKKPTPTVGAVIELDEGSRKILSYKNFKKYRDLEDDVANMISSLTKAPSFNDVNRSVIEIALTKATELQTKLRDYILYKYTNTTYEMNYKNFAEFIIEKRLIMDLYQTVLDNSNTK